MTKPKNFAQCYLYGLTNAEGDVVEKNLFEFLLTAQRINIRDQSFKPIITQLKSRVNNAVVIRMLQQGNVVLAIAKKEVPASFKVIAAKDPKDNRKEKIFVDVTGLINFENGFFTCNQIDRFATYMLGVLVYQIYTTNPDKLIRNGNIQKYSVSAFMKMFSSELDYLRLTGFMNNRAKISYIAGVYFAKSVMGLEINAARRVATAVASSLVGLNSNEAKGADYYYDEENLANINTFIEAITKVFKLEGVTTDIFVDRWIYLYGKGSHFALELYPVFLNTVIYAYSGTYLNNMKRIESVLGRDLVDLTTSVLKVGTDMFSAGFQFESGTKDAIDHKMALDEDVHTDKMKANLEKLKAMQSNADAANKKADDALSGINKKFGLKESEEDLDAQEITQNAIEEEPDNDGEVKTLTDEIEKDTVLESEEELDPPKISKAAIEEEPDNDGEVKSLIDELERDSELD